MPTTIYTRYQYRVIDLNFLSPCSSKTSIDVTDLTLYKILSKSYVYCIKVKTDKYYTPEQWKKMEEEKQFEEERRLREKGDNWRERGLDKMMGGVLEVKKEDELKKVTVDDLHCAWVFHPLPGHQFLDHI